MNRITSTQLAAALSLSLMGASAQAVTIDYSFELDSFWVFKNVDPAALDTPSGLIAAAPIFVDDFSNGALPGTAGDVHFFSNGNPATYTLSGAVGPETGGRLSLGLSGMVPNAFGNLRTNVTLNTDTSTDPTKGLKVENSNFAVVGVWDLINPGNSNGSYGVRFNDSIGGTVGNDIVSLAVQGRADGQAVVSFLHFNNTDGSSTLLDRQVLDSSHEQIGLGMAYMDTDGNGTKEVGAGYFYIDGGVLSDFYSMNADAYIFHGEGSTRAAFYVADSLPAPVPEPAEYLMMLAGLGLIGFAVRRRQQA